MKCVMNSLKVVARGTRWQCYWPFSLLPHLIPLWSDNPLFFHFPSPATSDTCNQPTHTCHRGNESLCFCPRPLRAPPEPFATASFLSAPSTLLTAQPQPHSCCRELVCFCSNEDLGRRSHFTLDSLQHPWYVSAFGDGTQACAYVFGCSSTVGNRVQSVKAEKLEVVLGWFL